MSVRCDTCLKPLGPYAVQSGIMRHRECGDAYMADYTRINARSVALGLEAERTAALQAHRATVLPSAPSPEEDMGKRGRKGHNPDGKPARVEIKAPTEEKQAAEAKAKAAGISLSEWTRKLWREAL